MKKNIVIFGATSSIAQEIAKLFANDGSRLFLIGRNADYLSTIANDLKVRGADDVNYFQADLNYFEDHALILDKALQVLGSIDIALIAHGTLPDQKECEKNFKKILLELNTNFISSVSLLTLLAGYFEKQNSGSIAVITSVAGDRGRRSNYVYGSAKAGLSTFLQGLRVQLQSSNVNVLTIKPGFVDTPMTQNFKKGLLWAKPEQVARAVVKSIAKKKQEIYTPRFWRYVMLLIKCMPEYLFCKLQR